jgi:hypothetical protein
MKSLDQRIEMMFGGGQHNAGAVSVLSASCGPKFNRYARPSPNFFVVLQRCAFEKPLYDDLTISRPARRMKSTSKSSPHPYDFF